jgi:hypothetical protein
MTSKPIVKRQVGGIALGELPAMATREEKVVGVSREILFGIGLILLLSMVRYLHDVAKILFESQFTDFAHYYIFSAIAAQQLDLFDPESLIRIGEIGSIRRSAGEPVYPPFFYILMQPWTWFSYRASTWTWLLANQAFLLGSVWLCLRRGTQRSSVQTVVTLFIVMNFQPVFESLALGQMNIAILFLAVTAWWALRHDYSWLAGVTVALAFTIKVQYGLLVPLLWLMGYRRASFWGAATCLTGLLAAYLQFGPAHFSGYVHVVSMYSSTLADWTMNLCPRAALHRLFGTTESGRLVAEFLWLGLSCTILVTLAILSRRVDRLGGQALDWAWGLGLTSVLFISPMAEEHHFVVLLFPLCLLLASESISSLNLTERVLLVAAIVLVGARYSLEQFPVFHQGLLSILMSGKTIGLGLTAWLLIQRLRAIKANQAACGLPQGQEAPT